jgi:hypothetical protein
MPKMTDMRRKRQNGTPGQRDDVHGIPDALQFESLAFVGQLPGPLMKYGSDLLSKITTRARWTFSTSGVTITSICDDTASNVSACVCLPKGMFHYVQCNSNTILDVESSELLLACKHLRRRDMVTLYVSSNMSFGIITETKFHTKNSIVASTEPAVTKAAEGGVEDFQPSGTRPSELHTAGKDWDASKGIRVAGSTFQRMIRDYRTSGKKINVTGNNSYVLFELDQSDALHRTDKIQSTFSINQPTVCNLRAVRYSSMSGVLLIVRRYIFFPFFRGWAFAFGVFIFVT